MCATTVYEDKETISSSPSTGNLLYFLLCLLVLVLSVRLVGSHMLSLYPACSSLAVTCLIASSVQ